MFSKLDNPDLLHKIEEDDDNNIKVYIGSESKIDDDVTVIKTRFKMVIKKERLRLLVRKEWNMTELFLCLNT